MDSANQRIGPPGLGSQSCRPLVDAVLIAPQCPINHAVYPSSRDTDQWGHDPSCDFSVCIPSHKCVALSNSVRFKHITSIILFSIAIYSAVYGVSYAYLLHHLANIFSAWLIGIYIFSSGFSVRRLWRILEGEELSSGISEVGGSHIKKKP